MRPAAMGSARRAESLRTMRTPEPLDVLVVGGGVVGAGVALDAVTRGLTVGVVEARDWASGTSSRSSKLIHGGLRYLEMLDFSLVREALRERTLITETLAPHLARPIPFMYPLSHLGWERLYVGSGVMLYDLMGARLGRRRPVPRHRHLSRRSALRTAPALRAEALTGAIQYYDVQVDDARHTLSLIRTAVTHGALAASRTQMIDLLRDGERVVGARVQDLETGSTFDLRARQVVNATGVWTEETQRMAHLTGPSLVRASKGVHVVVPRDRILSSSGIITRTRSSVLFVIPWGGHWIVGTSDADWALDKAHPAATAADIDELLRSVNKLLATPLTREDVVGVYAGLRPLLSSDAEETAGLSREHAVCRLAPGLVAVAGGKYTTYRIMARDVVDLVAQDLECSEPCRTAEVPCVGAGGLARWRASEPRIAEEHGLSVRETRHLLERYGSMTGELLSIMQEDPSLRDPVDGAGGHLAAEFVYACLHEDARHLEDVLTRRTRASIEEPDRGLGAAPHVARLMGRVLEWTPAQEASEIEHYAARVDAERRAHSHQDDQAANLARARAKDIVPVA